MKRNNRKIASPLIIATLIALFLQMVSCEKVIDVELNSSEPQITIEGTITPDSVCKVKISKSKDYYEENIFPSISGVTVKITDSEGNSEVLTQDADGLYVSSSIKGIEGRTYDLYVSYEGKEYTASSFLHTKVEIMDIEVYEIAAFDRILPRVLSQDPAGRENYYYYRFYINDRRIKNIYVANDDDRDGKLINQVLRFSAATDNDDKELEAGDVVTVELQAIDKGAYDFFETWARISEVQTNPISNIKGGALGYFSAYSSDTKTITIPEN